MRHHALLLAAASLAAACTVNVVRKNVDSENMQEEDEPAKPKPTATATATVEPTATATTAPTSPPDDRPKVCTKKGCFSTLRIDMLVGKAGWSNGTYTIDILADDKKAQCQVKVPLDCKQTAECTGDAKVSMALDGCDQADAKQRTLKGLVFNDAPAEVTVRVKRAGKLVGDQSYKPEYKVVAPNGPDCPPTCKTKQEELCIDKCTQ